MKPAKCCTLIVLQQRIKCTTSLAPQSSCATWKIPRYVSTSFSAPSAPRKSFHIDAGACAKKKKHSTRSEKVVGIDELATAPDVIRKSFAHLDEKAVLRKMDLGLIPMLALLYLLSFLDRGNIGNAKIEGLVEDLGMPDPQYNWCLTAFFFIYTAFGVHSNLLLKKLRPRI